MSAIGFDIGNQSCVIAAEKHGRIEVLLNYGLKRATRAVVSFDESQRVFGSDNDYLESTISHIKRLIGRRYKESSVQSDLRLLPFKTSEGPRGGVLIHVQCLNKLWTPVEILGMLFTHLKHVAEINLESPIQECVIGIPSYFTDLQRREYLDAAFIAGLKPLRLIHDCTAIALGYAEYKTDLSKKPTNVLFVDIGHCDTQASVVAFNKGKMNTLSHSFDENLGGRDFDEVLVQHFATKFKEGYNIDVYSSKHSVMRLRASCQKLKKVLSDNKEARLTINRLVDDTDVNGFITRDEFDTLSLELLERIAVTCINAVKEAGLIVDKIHAIELCGSGSQLPAISKKMNSILWKEPRRLANASEFVARGCALQCAMLSPTHPFRYYKVQDLFPYSFGFLAVEDENKTQQEHTLFPKYSLFPSDCVIQYPGKPPHCIDVFYTNKMDYPTKVGHFTIEQPPNVEKLKVGFKVKLNDHGIFEIESVSSFQHTDTSNWFGSTEKIVENNLQVSANLYVSTTKEELLEAQQNEQMLAEQEIKAEEDKDQRNMLLELMKNENKDQNAAAQATKHLLTCIANYRLIADALPTGLRVEVNNECSKAEQWLNDHSPHHHSSSSKIDPVPWPEFVKFSAESLERRCESILMTVTSQMEKDMGMQLSLME